MKQLACEMCGSTDLAKENGFVVCQSCGTKYSNEEAQKLIIEGAVEIHGKVTIDKTDEIEALLERAFNFLEDGDWITANQYSEKVLDRDPKNARAYLAKLMAELSVRKLEALKDCTKQFDDSKNYQKAIIFADDKLKDLLNQMNLFLIMRILLNFYLILKKNHLGFIETKNYF